MPDTEPKHHHHHHHHKLSPEIKIALLFVLLVLIVQMVIVIVAYWNSNKEKKMEAMLERGNSSHQVLEQQYQHTQRQYEQIKLAIANIHLNIQQIREICQNKSFSAEEADKRVESLKQNVQMNRAYLLQNNSAWKSTFGDEAIAALDDYLESLAKTQVSNFCASNFNFPMLEQKEKTVNIKLRQMLEKVNKEWAKKKA